jgi:predicted ATPase
MLLLLDNCEHIIDAAAGLAAAILSGTPGVRIWRPAASRSESRVNACTASARSKTQSRRPV